MKSIQVRDAADGFILVDQKKEQELTGRNSFTFPPSSRFGKESCEK